MSATIIWSRAGRSADRSSWLKLARDVERGSDGGTVARDGDWVACDESAGVCCVSLGDDDAGRRWRSLELGEESAMAVRSGQVGSMSARTFMPGS
jgi:hypothetical protein